MASKKRGSQQAKQGRAAELGYRQGNKPVSRTKPVFTKKEKLHGQELGKTGRAAERGGAVNKTQKVAGRRAEQQMYANRMKNTPIKQKLSGIALDLAVTAAVSPGTLRNVQTGLERGVNAVRNTGIPARISNTVRGRQVIVHGTPNKIEGSYLQPRAGSPESPKEPVVFGFPANKKYGLQAINNPVPYTQGKGSVVVGSAKKSATSSPIPGVVKSTKPVKVIGEVNPNKNFSQYDAELRKLLKRSGASIGARPSAPRVSTSKTKRF